MKKLKVFEAFSGYGSQRMALNNLGIEHEVVGISEIDKYAIQAYMAIHGETKNYGDISKINVYDLPEIDLFTYSFPCQDISSAGKQLSLAEHSGTRSSLLWECKRIISHCKPKYLLLENVKNLVSKVHKPHFDMWLDYLESLGYTNYYKVLNAKDYGIPQNRERVFVVSILGDHTPYQFPKPIECCKIQDLLEESNILGTPDNIIVDEDIKPSVRVNFLREQEDIVRSTKDIYACTCNSGWQDNKVGINVIPTVRAGNSFIAVLNNYRIQKLSHREALRFMGVSVEHIDILHSSGISKTQQYKLAGNSIVVPVLEHIFRELFINRI